MQLLECYYEWKKIGISIAAIILNRYMKIFKNLGKNFYNFVTTFQDCYFVY